MDGNTLLLRAVSALGFSPIIGPGLLRRALADAGVEASEATVDDYRRAFPEIEARVRAYIPTEASARLQLLRGMLDDR
jgi:hypothetical protein